jgi:hypothetical protein
MPPTITTLCRVIQAPSDSAAVMFYAISHPPQSAAKVAQGVMRRDLAESPDAAMADLRDDGRRSSE